MTRLAGPLAAAVLALALALPSEAAAIEESGLKFHAFLWPGEQATRVTLAYSPGKERWFSELDAAIYLDATGGGFLASTLYGTLFGFEWNLRAGYPIWLLATVQAEGMVLVAPVWVRVGPFVARLAGQAGLGIGGPASAHVLAGGRLQFFTDQFGIHLLAQYVPGSPDGAFREEKRLEAAVSIGPVHLGLRYTDAFFGYKADDKGITDPAYLVVKSRPVFAAFVGAGF